MNTLIDMTGQKLGRLLVIERAPNDKEGHAMWKCRCDCGNEVIVLGKNIRNGTTKSCGCLQRERTSKASLIDLVGKRFGKLVVLSRIPGRNKNGKVDWMCQCDCGSIVKIPGDGLRRGTTLSCGCIASQGELIISQILHNNDIYYKKEISFFDGRYEDSKARFFFDFGIYNDKDELQYIIEYDGYQHFDRIGGWNTKENNELTRQRDTIKNEYCFTHNIPLIRIPYTHKDKISIQDLLLSSSFLVTKDNIEQYYQNNSYFKD